MKIHLKDKNGVTLNTAKKYCEEDIEVRIDTEELNILPSTKEQVEEGLFDKVTVAGDVNLAPGNIKQGTSIFGVEGTLTNEPVEKYVVRVIDYDGTIIKEEELSEGEVFTMPDPPEHDNLIFQGWSSPVDIIDNTVIAEDQDIVIGPMYDTASGASEFDIEVTKVTGLDIQFRSWSGLEQVDWGDGTVNTLTTHTYTNYGKYTIKIYSSGNISGSVFYTTSNYKLNGLLKEARISNRITGITGSAFYYCVDLESISLPINLRIASTKIFEYCYSLKNLILPINLERTDDLCSDCKSLENIVIPKGVTKITTDAFDNINNFNNIYIPDTITDIGNYAFSGCYMNKIKLPNNVTNIGSYAFRYNFITEIVFPTGITNIGSSAFSYSYLLENVTLPENLLIVSSSLFANCYNLKNINIPDTVTEIGNGAFSYCYNLKSLVFPSDLINIAASAFSYCYNLRVLDFTKLKAVPTLANTSALSTLRYTRLKIIVPDELYDEWIAATNWSEYADYIYKASEVLV